MAKNIASIKRGEQKQQQTHQEYQRRLHQYTLFQLIGFIKFLNPLIKILLIIIWTINVGNCLVLHQRQSQQQEFLQQQNDFISQPEEKGAVFVTEWIKKRLCNNLTTTNFYSAESTPAIWPTDFSRNVVVSFWIKSYNETKQTVACNSMQDVYEDDFYYYIWLYKLLIYMLVASSFEILLLLARNLHNINLTISRCWTSLNMRMQCIFFSHLSCKSYTSHALLHSGCKATDSRAMSELHHNSNVTINFKKGAKRRLKSEIRRITAASTTVKTSPRAMETTVSLKPLLKRKGPLSYVFAVLGCHVSPSRSCSSVCCMFPYFKNENSTSFALGYTQVSAMGDFLLLMLFIHVYYQKQQQQFEQSQPAAPQRHKSRYYQQVHRSTDKAFSYLGDQKSCRQHCGNMHQKLWMPTYHVCAAPIAIPTTASATDDISIGTRPSAVVQCISQNSKLCSCFCCSRSNFWLQCCNCYCCPCYCCFACSMCAYTASCCTSYSCICCSICGVSCPTYQHFKTCCFIYYCNMNHRSCKYCNTCCQNGHLSTRANAPVEIVCVKFSKFGLFNRGNFLAFCAFRGGCSPYVWTLPLRTFGCYEILQAANGLRTYVPLCSNKSCRGGVFLLVYHYNYYQAVMQVLCQMIPHILKLHSCERSIKFHPTLCGIVPVVVATKTLISTNELGKTYNSNPLRIFMFANCIRLARSNHKKRRHRKSCCRSTLNRLSQLPFCNYKNLSTNRSASPSKFATSANRIGLLASLPTSNSLRTIYPCATSPVRTLRRLCGSKYNLTWLLISLVWFEGPKLTNCNVIINYQYQSPPPTNSNNNNPKATVTTKPDVEFDYKASNMLNSVHNVNITTLTRTANVYNTGSKNTQQICNNYQTHTRVQRALSFSNINLPTSASKLNVLWREHSFSRSKFGKLGKYVYIYR
uniref:Uncharacterized protein n=1 Tax=Glossina austeni TaxID=7395 RepID=A0A1A9UDE3_GLOAU